MKKPRLLALPLIAIFVAGVLAACGGSTKNVPQDAVAVVGSTTITKTQYNQLLDSAKATYKARKTTFPKVGTSAYKSLSDQAVTYLVQESELEQKAKEMGIQVTDKDVEARIAQIKQQYFNNDQKKYEAQLKSQGLTEEQLKQDLRGQILSEKIYNKVTADVKVSNADVKSYYQAHKSSYSTPETRQVAHILVGSKSQAQSIETQLKNGASFAALAKKYSKDTGSAKNGGELCVAHGQSTADGSCSVTVAPFDKASFSLATGQVSQPVHSQYGWHVIKAVGPIKAAHTTPFAQVQATIRTTLLSQKKQDAMNAWVAKLKKEFDPQISYQAGYAPATTSTSTAASTG